MPISKSGSILRQTFRVLSYDPFFLREIQKLHTYKKYDQNISFFLYRVVAKDDVDYDFVSFFGRRFAITLCTTAFAKVVVVVVDFFRARRTRTKLATQRCFGVSYLS